MDWYHSHHQIPNFILFLVLFLLQINYELVNLEGNVTESTLHSLFLFVVPVISSKASPLHSNIQGLQWEHLPNERAGLNSRGTIALILCSQPPLWIVCFPLDYTIVTLPKPAILTNKPTESLAGGLWIIFEFCFVIVNPKLSGTLGPVQ